MASPASARARRSARACATGLCASCVGTQAVRVVTTRAVHRAWRLMASPPQALPDGSSTRRRGDGAIAGGAGERRSAPVTVWPCRSGRFRPTALSPMGRLAGSVAASTALGRPKGRLQPWRAQRYRQRADGESLPIHGGYYRPEGCFAPTIWRGLTSISDAWRGTAPRPSAATGRRRGSHRREGAAVGQATGSRLPSRRGRCRSARVS